MAYRARLEVRFGDVDPAGIVYYPRLAHMLHLAMEDFFAGALELPYAELLHGRGLALPAVRLEVDFRRPLRFGDQLEVEVAIAELGDSSITWAYRVFQRGAEEASARARVVTVTVDFATLAKQPTPPWLRAALQAHQE